MELSLVERKYAVFGGGFGASQVVDRPVEWLLFLVPMLLAHALLIGFLFILIRGLHRKNRDTPLFVLNFLFATIVLLASLLAAKYELLNYFSDAISFSLLRNLGGGSISEALLYAREEAALPLLVGAGILVFYFICRKVMLRYGTTQVDASPLRWKHLLWLALPLVPISFFANREPDARSALMRINAYALVDTVLSNATDFDRDGYSLFGSKIDLQPFDGTRHPLALDIPNNGIDEDGIGGDFVFAGAAPSLATPTLPARRRHLVMVVLESTRADALTQNIDGRELTPQLNALGRRGSVIHGAFSHVGFTTESLKSLFSGTLSPEAGGPSLFRDLKANGYRIGVFSGQSESFGDIAEVVGSSRYADHFIDAEVLKNERVFSFASKSSLKVDARSLLREFDKTFSAGAWAKPNFIYFNLQEAHFPYHHVGMPQFLKGEPIPRSEIGPDKREQVARTYWNAVAYNDWLVGQIIGRLKKLGVWDDTLLVVTADHGESLFDDNFLGHGHVINRQQTNVLLIFSDPGVEVATPIGLMDYRPLILERLGGAARVQPVTPMVFQYIGNLQAPHSIGIIEQGDRWTIMTLDTEIISFSDNGRKVRYSDLAPGSEEKARADRLVNEWARQRWLAHLAKKRA